MNLVHIEDLLVGRQRIHPKILTPHPLHAWFGSRNVAQRRLARVLGVATKSVHNWLIGRVPMPPKRLAELLELKKKIESWEKRNRRIFGT